MRYADRTQLGNSVTTFPNCHLYVRCNAVQCFQQAQLSSVGEICLSQTFPNFFLFTVGLMCKIHLLILRTC